MFAKVLRMQQPTVRPKQDIFRWYRLAGIARGIVAPSHPENETCGVPRAVGSSKWSGQVAHRSKNRRLSGRKNLLVQFLVRFTSCASDLRHQSAWVSPITVAL